MMQRETNTMSRYQTSIIPYRLLFKKPAGTSRGVYRERDVWYVLLTANDQPGRVGVGECAPLPGLSCDAMPREAYEKVLAKACNKLEQTGTIDFKWLQEYPSILFGLETALRHFETGSYVLWDTPFAWGEAGIPINGLIWMGSFREMLGQVKSKLTAGYHCVKLKIGAIDFEKELLLLDYIRERYPESVLELRVDANGAFSPDEVKAKLAKLALFGIHSIEQPIRAGQWEQMAELAASTLLPIALDEELIGINHLPEKRRLLNKINPQYIVLKPSLHGGIHGCTEWIRLAEERGIGWWITSALESNIGLNAIAQWCATFSHTLPQGLGTGQLFTNNIDLPLKIRKDCLIFNPLDFPGETITVDGVCYTKGTYYQMLDTNEETRKRYIPLCDFLEDWYSDSPFIQVQTSGSTDTPKQMTVRKEQMRASARMTCQYMQLRPGDTALLCLDLSFIAGKMMVVRALTNGLNLITSPDNAHPLLKVSTPVRFAAMVPLQALKCDCNPNMNRRFKEIGTLLIGGSKVDPSLEKSLSEYPNPIYVSYGMTETLSHIALRRLNGPEASPYYTPFPGVTVSLSKESTLVIEAPHVSDVTLTTNDMAEILPDGRFLIQGRRDNVIISGGLKIHIEQVEEAIRSILSNSFAITSAPHPIYGEAVVMLLSSYKNIEGIDDLLALVLPRHLRPKRIIKVDNIPLTKSFKIDRAACKALVADLKWGNVYMEIFNTK